MLATANSAVAAVAADQGARRQGHPLPLPARRAGRHREVPRRPSRRAGLHRRHRQPSQRPRLHRPRPRRRRRPHVRDEVAAPASRPSAPCRREWHTSFVQARDGNPMKYGAIYPSLKGRTVLVTGGGSGIGEFDRRAFRRPGRRRSASSTSRRRSRRRSRRASKKKRQKVHFEPVDLTDIDALRAGDQARPEGARADHHPRQQRRP